MAETLLAARSGIGERLRRYLRLTKPRVLTLIVFCAVIGMLLATPGMVPLDLLLAATCGITLVAGAAAAVNCLIEQEIDGVMARTRGRPLPRGEVNSLQCWILSVSVRRTALKYCAPISLLLQWACVRPSPVWQVPLQPAGGAP